MHVFWINAKGFLLNIRREAPGNYGSPQGGASLKWWAPPPLPIWEKAQTISYLLQDNSNTLGAMIKGYSGSELADRSAMVVALSCAILRCRIWFEYVQSKSNWADEPSRILEISPWCTKHGFSLGRGIPPSGLTP